MTTAVPADKDATDVKTPSEPCTNFASRRRFGSLDGLRALSILAVIWHHTSAVNFTGTVLQIAGTHGVTLFFAISGFLITTLLLRERRRHGRIDLGAFYLRRSLRIFPLYYAVALLYLVLVLVLEADTDPGRKFISNLKYFLTYTSNIFVALETRTIFYFAWSLATEEQFYLVWPPLLVLLRSRLAALVCLALVLALLLADQVSGHFVLLGLPVAIVGGVLLAVMLDSARSFALVWRITGHRWAAPAFLLLTLYLVLFAQRAPFLIHASMVLLVAACVVREDHGLAPLLRQRAVAWMGAVSYGMYLLHMLSANAVARILHITPELAGGLPMFLLTTALALGLATLSFRYFESFFLSLKERFAR